MVFHGFPMGIHVPTPNLARQAQSDLLRELETRLGFLDEIETGLGHPRLSELQHSYGALEMFGDAEGFWNMGFTGIY